VRLEQKHLLSGSLNIQNHHNSAFMIDWRLTPTLAVFQLYRGLIYMQKYSFCTYNPVVL
jgi:hypothetical protein